MLCLMLMVSLSAVAASTSEIIVKFRDNSAMDRMVRAQLAANAMDMKAFEAELKKISKDGDFPLVASRLTSGSELVVRVDEKALLLRLRDSLREIDETLAIVLGTRAAAGPFQVQDYLTITFPGRVQASDIKSLLAALRGRTPIPFQQRAAGRTLYLSVQRQLMLDGVISSLKEHADVQYVQPNRRIEAY